MPPVDCVAMSINLLGASASGQVKGLFPDSSRLPSVDPLAHASRVKAMTEAVSGDAARRKPCSLGCLRSSVRKCHHLEKEAPWAFSKNRRKPRDLSGGIFC